MDLRRSLMGGLERLARREGAGGKGKGEVELVKGDVVLLLHRLHYLECKLGERERRVRELEEKMEAVRAEGELKLNVMRQRYEKQVQAMRLRVFRKESGDAPELLELKLMDDSHRSQSTDKDGQSTQNTSSVRKQHQFHRNLKENPEKTNCQKQQLRQECRKGESDNSMGLGQEEIRSEEMVRLERVEKELPATKSDEIGQEKGKRRKGKVTGEEMSNKRRELAQLVGEFKVGVAKQNYFAIDLQ